MAVGTWVEAKGGRRRALHGVAVEDGGGGVVLVELVVHGGWRRPRCS